MDDQAIILLSSCLVVASAGLLVVGGWCTPVEGVWQDGAKRVHLRRWAFVVRGAAAFDGGRQHFAGLGFFGRVLLWRRDHGEAHLLALGFPSREVPRLQGRVTGVFALRLDAGAGALEGAFYGRHFTFGGPRGASGRFVAASPRRLTRAER